MNLENRGIAVVGLGYVGLPLAIEYGKKYRVIGFDVNKARVAELEAGEDHTLEADLAGMAQARALFEESSGAKGLSFSACADDLVQVNTYIVTVPTPIDRFNNPDLTPLLKASETIGKTLRKGDQGPEVVTLQQALRELGYLTSAADGNFGSGTMNAVKSFQADNGLDADGIAGRLTQEKLFALSSVTPIPETTVGPGDIMDLPG